MTKTEGAAILTKPRFSAIEASKIYSELRQKVTAEGILDRDYFFYGWTTFVAFWGFFISLFFIVVSTSLFFTVFWSIMLVIFSIQLAGFFHDAGHRAVFKSSFNNDVFGYFVSYFSTISFSFWKEEHNMHHANPNDIEKDPDVFNLFIAFTQKKRAHNALETAIRKYQAYLYYPFGIFYLAAFRVRSLFYYKGNKKPLISLEIPFFIFGVLLWYIAPFLIMEPLKAIIFILAMNVGVGLYLMNIFAPNHKGMPQIETGRKFSFLEQQIITARNVKSNWFGDILFIGLNYQIEHHLFPDCPRNKLRLLTPYVKELCLKYDFEYTEVGIIETNKIILSELNSVALAS